MHNLLDFLHYPSWLLMIVCHRVNSPWAHQTLLLINIGTTGIHTQSTQLLEYKLFHSIYQYKSVKLIHKHKFKQNKKRIANTANKKKQVISYYFQIWTMSQMDMLEIMCWTIIIWLHGSKSNGTVTEKFNDISLKKHIFFCHKIRIFDTKKKEKKIVLF